MSLYPTMAPGSASDPGSPVAGSAPDDDRMKNAVAFLQHPKVAVAPLKQKMSFLQSKGLTKDEICRAFRQIDPNSPDALAIEKGTVDSPTPNQAPTIPTAQTPPPPAMYPGQQPVPMMYYPYAPPPLQTSSSRLPLYSLLATIALAAGGGIAYFYRHLIAEKILSSQKTPQVDDNLKSILSEMTERNQVAMDSLRKQSEVTQALLAKLTTKIESLSAGPSVKAETVSKLPPSERPDTLSPAVQALLEGTASNPAATNTTFDFAAANADLEKALSELEQSPESAPALPVLKIYIKNLIETGSESTRYHRISVSSPTYEQKVAPYSSALDLLKAVGFRKSDGFLLWQAPLGDPNSQDHIARKQILNVALERLTELANNIESREGGSS